MDLTKFFLYGPPILALILLIIKWPGMKKFLPAGLFASLAANSICHVGMIFDLWSYPFQIEEALVNCLIVPVMAMFWIRYAPSGRWRLLYWSIIWSLPLTGLEYVGVHYSNIFKYGNGYDWYYSLILWLLSWFVWYGFHLWFYNDSPNKQ
ncbi:MAG TPA: CBO0543 family protein [Syntrophomonadaceae bacterium]|nr:CBO0543 family protein [Syntrophomonadaceae bacterium]